MFANMKSLIALELEGNVLSGAIPDSIGELENLQFFQCNSNRDFVNGAGGIEGPLPTTLGNLKKLTVFACRTNLIDGEIPTEYGGMESLQTFDLEFNLVRNTRFSVLRCALRVRNAHG